MGADVSALKPKPGRRPSGHLERERPEPRVASATNLSFRDWKGEVQVAALDLEGVCASFGAACSSGVAEPSPVIAALHPDEPWRAEDEGPVHEAKLDPFFMSKFEFTQGQWQRFAEENPSHYKHSLLHPVEQVSWVRCNDELRKLGQAGAPSDDDRKLELDAELEGLQAEWQTLRRYERLR